MGAASDEDRAYGLGKGRVYPATAARALVNPLRRLIHPPARLARRLAPQPDARILEVGPGPGWFSPALAETVPDGRLHLVDLQAEMLEFATARLEDADTDVGRIDATVGDACALPFEDATFDAAFASAVLGETPDPARALAEIARVLRPGGRLLVLEGRGDPDRIPRRRLTSLAWRAGMVPCRRWGKVLATTTLFERTTGPTAL